MVIKSFAVFAVFVKFRIKVSITAQHSSILNLNKSRAVTKLTGGKILRQQSEELDFALMLPEKTAKSGAPQVAEHTYEDEVCYELSLQLAENLADIGACEYLREIRTDGATWLVSAVRA